MPPALPASAVSGGLAAALVSTLFQNSLVHTDPLGQSVIPLPCKDFAEPALHWPSLLLGLLLGLLLAQLLDLLVLARQALSIYVRQRSWWGTTNQASIKQRLA